MKKLLCLILIVSCLFAVCSCDDSSTSPMDKLLNTITGKGGSIEDFDAAIKNTNASSVIIRSTTVTEIGTLSSKYEIYYKNDGSATINYSYERFNEIGESADGELKTTYKGTVYRYTDGTYSEELNIDLSGVSAAVAIDLSAVKSGVGFNDEGDVLTVTVPKNSTESVLGTEINSDVALEITISDGVVKTVELSYEGTTVSYQYSVN